MDVLTETEIARARDAAAIYGANGSIPAANIARVARSVGLSPTQAEINAYLKGAQQISFPDLIELVGESKRRGNGREEILTAFKSLDATNTGDIEADTLRYYLKNMGEKLSDPEIDALIKPFDKGGRVRYEELVKALFA
eukprot:m.19511 g.19511  ORF g.19511 m.19511 type:complete len:139 (+) comp7603_c0_seq1:22-438(+)